MAILFEMTEEYRDFLENEYDVTFEGTMRDIKDIKKGTVVKYKETKKDARAFIKSGDYKNALKSLNEAKSLLKKIEAQARTVDEPEFIDYLKRVLLWGLIFNPVIAVPVGIITVSEAKSNFQKWIRKENEKIDETIQQAKDLQKNK